LALQTDAALRAGISPDKVYRLLFKRAVGINLEDYQGATWEGPNISAMGESIQTVMFGFANMSLKEKTFEFNTPRFPGHWKRVQIPIIYKGYDLLADYNKMSNTMTVMLREPAADASVTI